MAKEKGNMLKLGQYRDRKDYLLFPPDPRNKHLYVTGGTGTGKSKLLEWLIRQDIIHWGRSKCGLMLLDPHGSLYDSIIAWLAKYDAQRPIIPIDLRRDDSILAYNVLRPRLIADAAVVVDNMVDALAYVWGQSGTDQTPLFARWASNTLRALYERGYTLPDAVHLVDREAVRLRQAMTQGVSDPIAGRDWQYANGLSPKDFDKEIGSTLNRLGRFMRNWMLRAMLGQTEVSLDFTDALEKGHIILVCLAREKAKISKELADTFATLLINDVWTTAQERGKRPGLKPFYLYIDEFQDFVSPTVAENLDQSRGYGLHFTMAHQFPRQMLTRGVPGERLYDSIMENATTKAVFRLTHKDNLEPMAEWLFRGTMNPDAIKNILYSTKVVGYRRELMHSYAEGETETEGTSSYESEGSGESEQEGVSLRGKYDEENPFEPLDETRATSGGKSKTRSKGATASNSSSMSRSSGYQEALVPIMGKEISQIERRSLDEQLFMSMAVLFDQKERQFLARMGDRMKAPVALRTPEVTSQSTPERRVEKYLQQRRSKWPFFLSKVDAQKRLEAHEQKVLSILRHDPLEEPQSFRRRIK